MLASASDISLMVVCRHSILLLEGEVGLCVVAIVISSYFHRCGILSATAFTIAMKQLWYPEELHMLQSTTLKLHHLLAHIAYGQSENHLSMG